MMLRTAVSALALFGALGAANATAVLDPFACPGQTDPNLGRTSAVKSRVDPGSPNIYNFKVCNTSGFNNEEFSFLLRDWELPYDPTPGAITNIFAPAGWSVSIETIGENNANPATGWDGAVPTWFDVNDPFYDPRYLGLTQVIHFYTCGDGGCYGDSGAPALRPGQELEGFGFSSPFEETSAPYQASWVEFRPRSGDPAFPLAGANTPGLRNDIPEPSGLALFALSLGALMAARSRRRAADAE